MGTLDKLEAQLNVWLNTKAPVALPKDVRKAIADAAWAIALALGIVEIWGAWTLWHLGHYLNQVIYNADHIAYLGGPATAVHLGLFYWLSFVVTAMAALIMLSASPKLRKGYKTGWNLLYYAALLNAAYAILRLFAGVGGGFGGFLSAAIGAVVGAYFLFQIRDHFTGKEAAAGSSHHAATHTHEDDHKS
ncbi:MAG TPA: hypothetical protein VLF71_03875 [Candidatus Saccharimonadales bacterium]|nr:hypothetical protein [Candidatus Saccharimonadales bacterium]